MFLFCAELILVCALFQSSGSCADDYCQPYPGDDLDQSAGKMSPRGLRPDECSDSDEAGVGYQPSPTGSSRGSTVHDLFVLACFSSTSRVLTVAEIAKALDLSLAVVESVTANLVILGYLTLDASSAYLLADAESRSEK